jgi:HPt (histidine-containing phosphotransfer) domain-containing protein
VLDPSAPRSPTVIRIFLRTVPTDLDALTDAVRGGNADAIRKAAHRLKGGCLAVGVPRMAAIAAELEANPANRQELLGELVSEFERAKEQMSQLCASPSPAA